MATIGMFTSTAKGFKGSVKTLNLNVKAVDFVPAEGDNEKGPDYRIFAGATEFGAAWKKTSREAATTIPSSSTIRAFPLRSMRAWSRPKRRASSPSSGPAAPPSEIGTKQKTSPVRWTGLRHVQIRHDPKDSQFDAAG
ncbi:hypothetical protein Mesau_00562 [Mesorhizobium australicum WSM2073]|uniref:DUF736 domain-containing protein n=1 Tax=Mesorhizobium australicum (strain HAMBI 3006 / LMG 24608 / WSM2073) TaxID=754035 RepID=L0KCL3_MESAW|nr:hypothetical protein Mesau_00562 [Mesorhizobium australicum WSM2073]